MAKHDSRTASNIAETALRPRPTLALDSCNLLARNEHASTQDTSNMCYLKKCRDSKRSQSHVARSKSRRCVCTCRSGMGRKLWPSNCISYFRTCADDCRQARGQCQGF
eukprot:6193053-Pleurochrysis_carterae.AAC.7